MKKRITVIFIALVCLLAAGQIAYAAPDRVGKIDVGINVSGAIPTDAEADGGVAVGGDMAYGVNKWFAVGFSAGWQGTKLKSVTDGVVTIAGTDVNGVPIFGELILRLPIENQQFVPYGLVGLGTVIWSVDDTTATDGIHTAKVGVKANNAFAVKLGGGFDWFLNNNWILNFDAAYVFDRADVTGTVTSGGLSASATEHQKLDYWTIGGGVKYLFD